MTQLEINDGKYIMVLRKRITLQGNLQNREQLRKGNAKLYHKEISYSMLMYLMDSLFFSQTLEQRNEQQ